jgi:two-component sensor histidine kinase
MQRALRYESTQLLNVLPEVPANSPSLEAVTFPAAPSPDRETWISGQRHAFELALGDFPLTESLGVLVETATIALGPGTRGAFYLASPDGSTLHHIIGMPKGYARDVNGFQVGPEALACGLAIHAGEPVLTTDVRIEPRWTPWIWLADKWGYRGCWCFPLRAKTGRCIGAFAIYSPEPRAATPLDIDHATIVAQTAAIIISRHNEAEERKRAEQALRETQHQLETELADSELLRQLSVELADEEDESAFYHKLVGAAAKIMKSDVCTVQYFHPDRGPAGELQMLASTGLDEAGVKYWAWVRGDSGCTCGEVLRTGRRAIAEEVRTCSFMAGTPDRDVLLLGGIEAGQSTPLISRSGKLVGMISTHWATPHRPTERELRMLDILARPAADMIERKRASETQRLLLNELNHRVKNTLAVVQAMATRTLAGTTDPKEFSKKFGGRVQSLDKIHDLLSAKSWEGADLRELVRSQVSSGSGDEGRVSACGPAVRLEPQMALHVALIVHELGTNATKYGALSIPTGTVSVEWTIGDALRIQWTERGGPRVKASTSKGFGTKLITHSARGQGGAAIMTSDPEGIVWEITLPYALNKSRGARPVSTFKATPKREDVSQDLAGRRVLVIEDEPLIGMDIVAVLAEANAKVEGPVATIEEALGVIESSDFDAALVDANLHGRPVGAIALALTSRGIPFAFATGYGKDGLPEEFRHVPILRKPCGTDDIVRMAAHLLADGFEGAPTKA